MNAPASASCLKWQPMVRRRTAAGHSCGAGQSAAPSTHLAEVAGSLPAPSPPRAFFSAHSVQNPFRSGSTVSGRPRSNLVKASQTWPCRLAPRPHDPRPRIQDPRPRIQDPRPENGAGQARSSPVKVSQGQSNLDPNPLTRCLLSVTGLNRRRL
jgi:hypothetical protein